MKGDILDTCENKSCQFSRVSVPKLNKKKLLPFYLLRIVVFTSTILILSSFNPPKTKPFGITRVVIDAGHGGHDSGCLGKKSKEKDIALDIALKLGEAISEKFPDVKVIYTRKTDVFIELNERTNIANNAKADLFICIHCNSACYYNKKKKKEECNEATSGVETWVMGLHMSEANLEVSKRENDVVLLEKDYTKKYDGFDPNSPEANIIFSLYQNTFLDQSLKLASHIQQEMKVKGRSGRGVKQAGFLVLYKTTMPSVLIETGFLSNVDEEKYLSSEKGQDETANAIFKAFKSYKHSVETGRSENEGSVKDPEDTADSKNVKEDVKPQVTDDTVDSTVPEKETDFFWAVQFYVSQVKMSKTSSKFKGLKDIREVKEGKTYKYTTGEIEDQDDAVNLQSKVRKLGFKDAFVVGFSNGKKVSYKEAVEISKQK
ncbi:MAG: N-acetylmuramoyl-L-alanine amidase [Bacteroidetes bacterium]|jgi:N-acetylmuramoyl-L-alanine amidase|nr:N-acetylmuramoyl-L-alanine amidase [Bacteroidota bacterium]